MRGAPDLVVEILSPQPRIGRLDERLGWFAEFGVRECWLVYEIDRRLDVLAFEKGRVSSRHRVERTEAVRSTVLPEFRPRLTEILG